MARTKSFPGLILSGKIGNLVFVQHGDEVIVRTLPERRKPDSWSEKQLQQRKRFQAARLFYNSVRENVVNPIWKLSATKKLTAYNLFLKANLGAFDKNGELADYSRLHFSTGPLPLPQQLTAARSTDNPGQVIVRWNPEAQSKAELANDELLCVWAREGQRLGPIATGSVRGEGQRILEHPSVEAGESWNLYLFFRNKNHTSYSDDKHIQL